MTPDESIVLSALARIGVAVTPGTRPGQGWGWSISNAKLVQPWVGSYPTAAAATEAALDWLMLHAWRGVLYPLMQAANAAEPGLAPSQPTAPTPEADDSELVLDEELLAPWMRALHETRVA